MIDPRTEVREPGRIAALWMGLLLAPVAFLANLEFGYLLVHPSCLRDDNLPVHVAHAVCLLLGLLGALVAWRSRRAGGSSRTRFMAELGLLTSALFVLSMVAQWIPTFVLHPCQ